MKDTTGWIQTFTGRKFFPLEPDPQDICIEDIAHALALQCRYTGHCSQFYSVAQHSVLVSYVCDPCDAFSGLMHDAAEAYLLDMPRPVKRTAFGKRFKDYENVVSLAIAKRFGFPEIEPMSVKRADMVLLVTEARDLMSPLHPDWHYSPDKFETLPEKIKPWSCELAEREFLIRFERLTHATN